MAANATGSSLLERALRNPVITTVTRLWQAWTTPRSTQRDLAFRERSIRAMIVLETILILVIISNIIALPGLPDDRALAWSAMLPIILGAALAVSRGKLTLAGILLISIFVAAIPITALRNGFWSGSVVFAMMLAIPTCALLLTRRQAAAAAGLIILLYLALVAWAGSRGITPESVSGPDPLVYPMAAASLLTTGFGIFVLIGHYILSEFDKRMADLQDAYQRLQELDLLKDQFIDSVSHELKTPITSLKLYHHLLHEKPQRHATYLKTLDVETERLEQIVEGTLVITRMVKDLQAAPFHPVDIAGLMEQTVTQWQPKAANHDLTLRHQPVTGLPPVSGNVILLGNMLSILLDNAVKYTLAGSEALISTQLEHIDDKNWVVIRVESTGYSITPEEVPHLFTRFFRGRSSLEAGVPGAGVGLFIAAEIVRRHDGTIQLENKPAPEQAGAVFAVRLPAAVRTN